MKVYWSISRRDVGLLLYQEFVEANGLTAGLKDLILETHTGKNVQHSVTALLRQSVYDRLAGNKDTNNEKRLQVDPSVRRIVMVRASF